MGIIGIGLDMVELSRIERSLRRFGEHFLDRIMDEEERRAVPGDTASPSSRLTAHVAARFAAKEAAVKALGTGFAAGIGPPESAPCLPASRNSSFRVRRWKRPGHSARRASTLRSRTRVTMPQPWLSLNNDRGTPPYSRNEGFSMELRGTTILCVRHKGQVALIGDGQVTMGQSIVMKHTARKVRRMYKNQIIAGFAGATADAFTLFERFEAHLEQNGGNLLRAAVELAKDWRSDKYLRKLEAMLLVADKDYTLMLTGTGDVIEPDDGIASIGSGPLRPLRRARPCPPQRSGRGNHRPREHEDRLRSVRLHQHQLHHRSALGGKGQLSAGAVCQRFCRPA